MEEENTLEKQILTALKDLVVKVDKMGLKLYHMENKIDDFRKMLKER